MEKHISPRVFSAILFLGFTLMYASDIGRPCEGNYEAPGLVVGWAFLGTFWLFGYLSRKV